MKDLTKTEDSKFGILSAVKASRYGVDTYDADETRLFEIPKSALIRDISLICNTPISGHSGNLTVDLRLANVGEDFASVPTARQLGAQGVPNTANLINKITIGGTGNPGKIYGSGNANFILVIKPTYTLPTEGEFRILVRYENLSRRDRLRD